MKGVGKMVVVVREDKDRQRKREAEWRALGGGEWVVGEMTEKRFKKGKMKCRDKKGENPRVRERDK